jgi:hypothetical protein
MADDDIDTSDNTTANHSMPDPFVLAIELCRIATNAKAIEPALKRLRKLGHDIAKAEQKLAAVTAQAEQTKAELAARAAAIDERERAITQREDEFESSIKSAHAELRQAHDSLADTDRRIRYRIMASANLLAGFNEQLQDLPSWQQIGQMVPGLPDDPPSVEREGLEPGFRIDAFADTFSDPNSDRHGNTFLGSLTRDVSHKGAQ